MMGGSESASEPWNHYETTSRRRSKDCKPILRPHRDHVNDADVSIVLGITTPTCDYCGAMMYVSKERDGKIWYNKVGSSPSRRVSSASMSAKELESFLSTMWNTMSLLFKVAEKDPWFSTDS